MTEENGPPAAIDGCALDSVLSVSASGKYGRRLPGGPAKGVSDPLCHRQRLGDDHPAVTRGIGVAALSPILVSLLGCREHGDVQVLTGAVG